MTPGITTSASSTTNSDAVDTTTATADDHLTTTSGTNESISDGLAVNSSGALDSNIILIVGVIAGVLLALQ
jgi:hypothetical protein